MYDLMDPPWERLDLDAYGFAGVSAEFRRLNGPAFREVVTGTDYEAAVVTVKANVRSIDGVGVGGESVTDLERVWDLAPQALVTAITRRLIEYSQLAERERKNS